MKVSFSEDKDGPTKKGSKSKTVKGASPDLMRSYLQEIGRIPLLSGDEEIALANQVQKMMALLEAKELLSEKLGYVATDEEWATEVQLAPEALQKVLHQGQRAKKRMIEANLRLVVSVAKKYQNRNLDLLDLIQEGSMGLERAVEKFDPLKGYKFSTYGYWWIRQGITRAIAQQARTIRLPIHITEKLNKIKRTQRELSQSLGRTPTSREIAQQLDLPVEEIKDCLMMSRLPLSLEMRIGDEQDTELGDLLQDEHSSPEEAVTQNLFNDDLRKLLDHLPPKQREVINLRYGLTDGNELTLAAVGERLNISRERVRQLQHNALKSLRLKRSSIESYLDK